MYRRDTVGTKPFGRTRVEKDKADRSTRGPPPCAVESVMNHLTRRTFIPAALMILMAGASQLFAAQSYTLKPRSQPGDKWAFDVSNSISQKGQVTVNGQPQPIDQSAMQRRKGVLEILSVADDMPTAVRVKYDLESKNSGTLAGQAAPPFALVGRTVTVRRSADGQVTNDLPEQPDEQSQAELARLLDPDLSVYPAHPVAVGDEWDADNAALARQFQLGPDDKVSMKCKLRGIQNLDGRQVADVGLSGQVIKHDQEFIVTTTHLEGQCEIDLATGQTLESDITGKMSSRGNKPANPSGGGAVIVDAEGELKMQQRVTPIALAGAPVAAAPAPPGADAAIAAAPMPVVENPLARHATTSLAGLYKGDGLEVDFTGDPGHYTGTIKLRDKSFLLSAHGEGSTVAGTFDASGSSFKFTATLDGDTLTLVSDGNTYVMKRVSLPPAAPPPKNPLAP